MRDSVRASASRFGIALDVKNFGQHYIFTRQGFRAEWWPSTGKLVFNQKWDRPLRAGPSRVVALILRSLPPERPAYLDRLEALVDG